MRMNLSNLTDMAGILKSYLSETHRAMSQNLAAYFGPEFPALTLKAPHMPSIDATVSPRMSPPSDSTAAKHLSVVLISAEDGRDSIVDLTKTLTEMAQRSKIASSDVSIDLLDAELSESVMSAPDLLILFGPHVDLAGYPPWPIRLTEIFHLQDNHSVGYQVFYRGLCSFARAQMRFGR
jgi:undecaprenyl pyrophosphate synthase